jgi:hypothetical protein
LYLFLGLPGASLVPLDAIFGTMNEFAVPSVSAILFFFAPCFDMLGNYWVLKKVSPKMGVVIYTRFGSFFASRDALMTQKKLGLVRVV